MDFSFDKNDEQFRKDVKAWVQRTFPEDEIYPKQETNEEKLTSYRTYQKRLFEGGYSGVRYPKESIRDTEQYGIGRSMIQYYERGQQQIRPWGLTLIDK